MAGGRAKSFPYRWKQAFSSCFAARPRAADAEAPGSPHAQKQANPEESSGTCAGGPGALRSVGFANDQTDTIASEPALQRSSVELLVTRIPERAHPPAEAPATTQPLPLRYARSSSLLLREDSYRFNRSLSSNHDSFRDVPRLGSTTAPESPLVTVPSRSVLADTSITSHPGASPDCSDPAASHPSSTSGAAGQADAPGIAPPQPLQAYENLTDVLDVANCFSNTFEALTTADLTLDVTVAGTATLWTGGARSAGIPTTSNSGLPPAVATGSGRPPGQGPGPGQGQGPGSSSAPVVELPPASTAPQGPQAERLADVAESGRPQELAPAAPARTVLNLSQVRELVTELRVLHIRPGAALLIGTATATGVQVVARFERGRPGMLLAPQLLSALASGRGCPAHDHVVSTLAVHAIALPAQILNAPSVAGQLDASSPHPSPAVHSQAHGSQHLLGAPSLNLGVSGRSPGSDSPLTWLFDKDLATATLALQHAEAVRGASNGSGVIGSGAAAAAQPSSGNVTGSARLLRALGGPQVRLRDVVGHLRGPWPRLGMTAMSYGSLGGQGHGSPGPACAAARAAAAAQPGSWTSDVQLGDPRDGRDPLAAASGMYGFAGPDGVDFVTLTITELCEGGSLFDEARRGAFRCCSAEPLTSPPLPPPPPPRHLDGVTSASSDFGAAASSTAATAQAAARRYSGALCPAAVFGRSELVRRLECFVATAQEVALGLRHLHTACGLAHGDLASRNVLLQRRRPTDTADGRGYVAKLAGYGRLTAAPLPPAAGSAAGGGGGGGCGLEAHPLPSSSSVFQHLSATSLTRVNTIHVGLWRDVHSLAPERLADPAAPPTFEADVYAFGTILYEMAMGESPWVGMTAACVAVGTVTGDLRIQCQLPCVLPSISDLIERCTSPHPADRPSVDDVLAALEAISGEIRVGRDAHAARQHQQLGELLMHTFLDSDSTSGCTSG